jgi:glycosyltransferase involved in cell wall biosynthesis
VRLGIDLRGINYDSAGRGIGALTAAVCEGIALYAPDAKPTLFVRRGLPLAPRIAALPAEWPRVEVPTFSWQDQPAHWPIMNVRKVRALPPLRDAYHRWLTAESRKAFTATVRSQPLDLLFLPSAVDLGSYPCGDFSIPVAATFLDAIPLRDRAAFYDRWSRGLREHYDAQLQALRGYARVLAISRSAADDAVRYAQVDPARLDVVYCGIPDFWFEPPLKAERAAIRMRFGTDRPTLLFISALDQHKNWRRLLQAFAPLAGDCQLVFVAKSSGPAHDAFAAERARLGIRESDAYATGWLEESELRALVSEAAGLVSPSLHEGFGLPAAQALAQGTPVAASNTASLPEVVLDAGVLFDPLDVGAITKAMEALLVPGFREAVAARARAAASRFRLQETTRHTMEAFRKAVGT